MPLVFAILGVIAVIVIVAALIPIVAGVIATALLGRQAKLDAEDKIVLGFYFYLITSVIAGYLGYVSAVEDNYGTFGIVLNTTLVALFWPIGVGLTWMNGLMGSGGSETDGLILMLSSFAITQAIAVLMVVKRAKKRLEE